MVLPGLRSELALPMGHPQAILAQLLSLHLSAYTRLTGLHTRPATADRPEEVVLELEIIISATASIHIQALIVDGQVVPRIPAPPARPPDVNTHWPPSTRRDRNPGA